MAQSSVIQQIQDPELFKKTLAAVGAVASLCGSAVVAHEPGPDARFLANAGVTIRGGDQHIVFDGIFDDADGPYTELTADDRAALLAGQEPHAGVSAVFVSHVHDDHFSAEPVVEFLRRHETVVLFGTEQVRDALGTELGTDDPLLDRVIAVDLEPTDQPAKLQHGGLAIEAVAVPHAGNRSRDTIANLVWRVTLSDGETVMHLGDAGAVRTDFDVHAEHFSSHRTQLALVPYWLMNDEAGREIIDQILNVQQVIGVHVPAVAHDDPNGWRDRADGDLFIKPGEIRRWSEWREKND